MRDLIGDLGTEPHTTHVAQLTRSGWNTENVVGGSGLAGGDAIEFPMHPQVDPAHRIIHNRVPQAVIAQGEKIARPLRAGILVSTIELIRDELKAHIIQARTS